MILEYLSSIIAKDEDNHIAKVYDYFMFVTIIVSIVPLMFTTENALFDVIERVTVTIFIVDYMLRWITFPVRSKKSKLSWLIYPFTPMAIIDLLSIIPAISMLNNSFKLFRLTRLVKISRVIKALRYSKRIEILGRVLYKERYTLTSVFLIAVVYIFITGLIMFNVEPRINPQTEEVTFKSFFDALYWASITLTTVGYGDICPVTTIGRFISILSSLFGVVIIALPSGVITASYLEEIRHNRNQKK